MKKLLTLVATTLALSLAHQAKAQYYTNDTYRENTWRLSVGPEALRNQNPGNGIYGFGLGAEAALEYYPNNYVGITLTTGYFDILGLKPKGIKQPDFTFIPAKLGIKGFFQPKLYISGDIGLGYARPMLAPNTHLAKTIAPAIGYNNPDNGFDVSIRYENMNNHNHYISMFALRVAYSFEISGGTGF